VVQLHRSVIEVEEFIPMDIVFVGVVIVFFALAWGLVKLCERL